CTYQKRLKKSVHSTTTHRCNAISNRPIVFIPRPDFCEGVRRGVGHWVHPLQSTHEDMHWVKFLTVNLAGMFVTNAATIDENTQSRLIWSGEFSCSRPILALRL